MLLFRQFVNDDLGCASYLVGDDTEGVAVVVDPPFEIEPLADAAAESGVRIERVLETHTHADHVSGHGRFALEQGLPVAIHPLAEPRSSRSARPAFESFTRRATGRSTARSSSTTRSC